MLIKVRLFPYKFYIPFLSLRTQFYFMSKIAVGDETLIQERTRTVHLRCLVDGYQ